MTLKLEHVPGKAVVVRRGQTIASACWIGAENLRPYVYPFLGPENRELTRLDHPLDPVSHSHHKSIWIGHHDVGGHNFWEDSPRAGRIEVEDVQLPAAQGESVTVRLKCTWRPRGAEAVLEEDRRLTFSEIAGGGLSLDIDLRLRATAKERPVKLGDTPFGLLGIRVARTLRVEERLGGLIFNSSEAENEAGCFWQHAEWCDYSGPVPLAGASDKPSARSPSTLPSMIAGIACFDHPENSPLDTFWHTRDDGWMGPCISKGQPRVVSFDDGLRARYRIESHAERPWRAGIGGRYRAWRRK